MGIISDIGKGIAGDWIKVAVIPGLFLAAVTGWHQFSKAREEAREAREAVLIARGRQQCVSEIELATARAEALVARQAAEQSRREAEAAALANEEARGNVDSIKAELDQVKSDAESKLADCSPRNRISDSVLNLIGGDQGVAGKGGGNKGR